MYTTALILLSTLSLGAPCVFEESETPSLFLWDRVVYFQKMLKCEPNTEGSVEIKYSASKAKKSEILETEKIKIKTYGKWAKSFKVGERLFPNHYCKGWKGKKKSRQLLGPALKERVVSKRVITLSLKGDAALGDLQWKETVDVFCDACTERPRGKASIRSNKGTASMRFKVSANRSWFECAKYQATLSLRFFSKKGQIDVRAAIRPILEIAGLEKRFKKKKDLVEALVDIPNRKLCKKLGKGKHKLMWELVGKGELQRIGRGGRTYLDLVCR